MCSRPSAIRWTISPSVLAERGWDKLTIGVEMDNYWFSAAAFASLQKHLPNARFVDATALVNWQRAVKSPTEIDYMRKAARIVEAMHQRIVDKVEVGMRKCDLVAEIYDAGIARRRRHRRRLSGDRAAAAVGADASAPHLTWDDKPMKAGEGTFFEIAGCYNRYHCPLSRTVFLGKPTQEFLDAEKATLEGMEAGLAAAKPGNACEDIANAFFAVLKKYGIVKDNRTGYPIGLSYPPDWGERTMSLRPGDRTELKPGMTFHFMTGLWLETMGLEITEVDPDHRNRRRVPGQCAAQAVREGLRPMSLLRPSPIAPTVDFERRRRPARLPAPALQPRRLRLGFGDDPGLCHPQRQGPDGAAHRRQSRRRV